MAVVVGELLHNIPASLPWRFCNAPYTAPNFIRNPSHHYTSVPCPTARHQLTNLSNPAVNPSSPLLLHLHPIIRTTELPNIRYHKLSKPLTPEPPKLNQN